MPSVTVLGSNQQHLTLVYDSSFNAGIATQLAAALTTGIDNGSIVPFNYPGTSPILSPAQTGEMVVTTSGASATAPPGFANVVVPDSIPAPAANATVYGSGDPNERILSTEGNLNFIATGGSGTVASGGATAVGSGGDLISIPGSDDGNWGIYTGGGNDTIDALGSGNDTISPGLGNNLVVLGSGADSVLSAGSDVIYAGDGSDTIDAAASGASDRVQGGAGTLLFIGGNGPSTVLAGTGSATLMGGSGNDLFYAQGSLGQMLQAGSGNDTLSALQSSGADSLMAGSGADKLLGGTGSDTFYGGAGASTMYGGTGYDLFTFSSVGDGGTGSTDQIMNFSSSRDAVHLEGLTTTGSALSRIGLTVTLSDNTKVTFVGIAELSQIKFV